LLASRLQARCQQTIFSLQSKDPVIAVLKKLVILLVADFRSSSRQTKSAGTIASAFTGPAAA
jgi:hypothetical protein